MSNLYFDKNELLVNTANFAVEPTFLKGPRSIISEGLVPGPLYDDDKIYQKWKILLYS